jgi:NAD(P)H-nitrite reductase large subunit
MRIVIVGGGIAGTSAAEELRRRDPNCEITLVCSESHPLYSRVLLTPYITGRIAREKVFLKKPEWYTEQKIEWIPEVDVERLDTGNKFIALSNGRELPYDKLLIASGCDPRLLQEDLRGVSYLRSIDDADHLLRLLDEVGEGASALVYGGGFIGCEYLDIFTHFKLQTAIAFRGPWFWSKTLDRESGELINEHLKSKGVEVITDVGTLKLQGEQELASVKMNKNEKEINILGIGIGLTTNAAWIADSKIEISRGVRVDDQMQTVIKDVYAAGDIVEYKDPLLERSMVVRNWTGAIMQGRQAAKAILGIKESYTYLPSSIMNALGLPLIFVGDTSREHADKIVVRGSKTEGGVTQLFIREGRLVGVSCIGRPEDRVPAMKIIQSKEQVLDKIEAWKDIKNSLE